MPLTGEDSAVESRGSENRRSARAEMCRTSALGKKEARAGENGKVGRHKFGFTCKKVQQMEAGRCLGKGNKYRRNEQIEPLMTQFSYDN